MKILVTGANGFVGSSLICRLEEEGHMVGGIDKDDQSRYPQHSNTLIGDITRYEDLQKLPGQYDMVIHCAAAKHDFGVSEQEYYHDNQKGTEVLLDFMTDRKIHNIIYYSTVSVYGHQDGICFEDAPLLSNTVYGDSKLAGEVAIENWLKRNKDNRTTILRPSVIYGVNNYANMYNLMHMMYTRPYAMIGGGNHVKSMVSLKNLIELTLFVINKDQSDQREVYNCIDAPYLTLNQIMRIIASVEGFRMPKIRIPVAFAYVLTAPLELLSRISSKDMKINWNRISKLTTATDYRAEKISETGYKQKYTTEEELSEMCAWYKSVQKTTK